VFDRCASGGAAGGGRGGGGRVGAGVRGVGDGGGVAGVVVRGAAAGGAGECARGTASWSVKYAGQIRRSNIAVELELEGQMGTRGAAAETFWFNKVVKIRINEMCR
jgi:hypothetical protein